VGIPRVQNNQVSAMNSFVRNIGGSIGIALISTAITRQAQVHQNYMVAHAVTGNRAFDQFVGGLRQSMLHQNQPRPMKEAYGRVMGLIQGQATTLAYIDVISVMSIAVALLPPFILFMRRPKAASAPPAAH
jgi:DHA2 family multidrug resistance protein